MRIIKTVALLFVLTFFTACGGNLTTFAESVLYPFDQVNKKYQVPETPPEGLGQVYFNLVDSDNAPMKIHAWFSKQAGPTAHTLVYFHGNGENLEALRQGGFYEAFKNIGFNFIVVDYSGLGRSTGSPNEENLTRGGVAAVEWVTQNLPRSHIVIWGRSLGAAVACQVAHRKMNVVSGLIITSGWNRLIDVAIAATSQAKNLPEEWLSKHRYDSQAAARDFTFPILDFHGTADKTIPIKFGQLLYASMTSTQHKFLRILEGREHNNMFQDPQLWQDVRAFKP